MGQFIRHTTNPEADRRRQGLLQIRTLGFKRRRDQGEVTVT